MSYQLTPREELEVALRREAQERFTSYGPYSSLPNYDDVLNADHACGCLFEHGSWALRIYYLVGLILFFGAPELFVFAILVVAAVEKPRASTMNAVVMVFTARCSLLRWRWGYLKCCSLLSRISQWMGTSTTSSPSPLSTLVPPSLQ